MIPFIKKNSRKDKLICSDRKQLSGCLWMSGSRRDWLKGKLGLGDGGNRYSLSRLWWWFHVCVHIYVKTSNCLNVCSLLYVIIHNCFPGGSAVKNTPAMQETRVQTLGQEDPLEKKMATHSSILAWEILWIEEPGGLMVHGVTKGWTWLWL